ncbi:cysteine hydrolase family protein [Adhaeribacter rhizoryzae]|uniref:Cysteine hydrolase n=1 Tax=Adhaeribacter rhizoryzae TaxID=2607907 RepID=A0A5M6DEY7_9BACT|nr:cysteine hydrolase family protein [Adhaeribacter rhizoryzae]KAA5544852.1 cysteine hydrolase [Adhaeribacter rhizoryzae]
MSKALIIIDIQKDYFKGGAMELHNPVEASENAKQVLEKFRNNNEIVIHIQHLAAAPEIGFFLPNTQGAEIHENVKPKEGEKVITKYTPNAFLNTDLLEYLQANNITELIFTGMMTQMCIDATVRAAKDYGFECTVIGDACATRDLKINGNQIKAKDVHNAFLAGLSFYYAQIKSTNEYLAA